MDGPAALTAWSAFDRQDWEALYALDDEIMAMRASSAARRSIRATGLRLIATWSVLYPYWRLGRLFYQARLERLGPALPIAFGCVCASAGVEIRETGAAPSRTTGWRRRRRPHCG
jgi:urease accessory protein UreF